MRLTTWLKAPITIPPGLRKTPKLAGHLEIVQIHSPLAAVTATCVYTERYVALAISGVTRFGKYVLPGFSLSTAVRKG